MSEVLTKNCQNLEKNCQNFAGSEFGKKTVRIFLTKWSELFCQNILSHCAAVSDCHFSLICNQCRKQLTKQIGKIGSKALFCNNAQKAPRKC
jgi:hypothetical protein